MNNAGVSVKDRKVVDAANKRAEETGHTAAAIELPDGTILTGKTSDLMGACSALLIKALKHLAGIDEDVLLITPNVIRPIQKLKVDYLAAATRGFIWKRCSLPFHPVLRAIRWQIWHSASSRI